MDIEKFWTKLSKVDRFRLSSSCRKAPPSYPTRTGVGEVKVEQLDEETLTVFQKGKWIGGDDMAFTNVFCWKLNRKSGQLSLEHLRFGASRPVFLFDLILVDRGLLKSVRPHECKEDTYFGSVLFDEHYIQLNWRIIGPSKSEMISQYYE